MSEWVNEFDEEGNEVWPDQVAAPRVMREYELSSTELSLKARAAIREDLQQRLDVRELARHQLIYGESMSYIHWDQPQTLRAVLRRYWYLFVGVAVVAMTIGFVVGHRL